MPTLRKRKQKAKNTLDDTIKTEDTVALEAIGEEDLNDDNVNPSTSTKIYYDYDPTVFASQSRYRSASDIVANTIIRSQANGVDRYEIGKQLLLNCKAKGGNRRVSALIQQLLKIHPEQVSQYQKMEGKIRFLKYFYKGGESTPSSFLELLEKLEQLVGQKFPYCCSDIIQFPGRNLTSLRISDITLRRFLFIMEFLKQEDVIVLTWRLSRYIAKKEAELGYQFAIDKKSVMKCLFALEQKQLLRVMRIENVGDDGQQQTNDEEGKSEETQEVGNIIQVVTPYEIDTVDHPRIVEAINRVIEELNTEGRLFPTGQYVSSKLTKPTGSMTTAISQIRSKRLRRRKIVKAILDDDKELITVEERYSFVRQSFDSTRKKTASNESLDLIDEKGDLEPEGDADYGYQSKLMRCAVLHEFIFRVVHELQHDQDVPSLYNRFPIDKCLRQNSESTPLELLPVVDNEPGSPYRHVVRIPPFRDAQRGWFMVRDVLLGMPVSIYVLVVKLRKPFDGLQEFLDDPERRHIPIGDLPVFIRKQLFNRASCLIIEYLCLLLSVMGLMRVAPSFKNRPNVLGPHALFFCGKKASFYDTSTSGRGYALVIPPITQYKRYDYAFESIKQIQQYWNHLKAICWSTALGARHLPEGQEDDFKSEPRKYAQGVIDRTPVTVDYKTEIDEILPVGTFDGCAGFDAQLFTHLQRNWELRLQPGSSSTEWFVKRWQQISARLSSYVSARVSRLEKNWNSYISTFLPTDLDMVRKKKSEFPILTKKTLESLQGSFRRHNKSLRNMSNLSRKKTTQKKSTLATISTLLDSISPGDFSNKPSLEEVRSSKSTSTKRGKKSAKSKKVSDASASVKGEESMEVDDDDEQLPRKRRSGQKRKLDAIDLESAKLNMNLRSRFTNNEYDMLVLIRSISYFLNPIHRFWLNPTVMRDIMHLHDSRCKTVSSLLAASAREMLRPGRNAQLQYIVKTFSADKKMTEIREKLAIQCKTDEEKNEVFWQAFNTAYKLIFEEPSDVPSVMLSDKEFEKELQDKKMIISMDGPVTTCFPRRSREPKTIDDVRHCIAYNIVMSTLMSDACATASEGDDVENKTQAYSEFLVNNIMPSVLTEVLEVCRSDGFVTRVRHMDASTNCAFNKRLQISIFYRYFFNHLYCKDLIDSLKAVLLSPNSGSESLANSENPGALLRMIDSLYEKGDYFDLNLSNIADLIDCNLLKVTSANADEALDKAKAPTKNMKQLEHAPMRLEKIGIDFASAVKIEDLNVPSHEDVIPLICPIYECHPDEENPLELQEQLSLQIKEAFGDQVSTSDMLKIFEAISGTEFHGATVDELMAITSLSLEQLNQLLVIFTKFCFVFPCGVDQKRYVAREYCSQWLIKTNTHRFGARPWTLPDGLPNWSILRWMSESILMTVHAKPGIVLKEMFLIYSSVLSPVLVQELIDFLIRLGCCSIKESVSKSCRLMNPFSLEASYETIKFLDLCVGAFNRFAIFFTDVSLPEHLLHTKK